MLDSCKNDRAISNRLNTAKVELLNNTIYSIFFIQMALIK